MSNLPFWQRYLIVVGGLTVGMTAIMGLALIVRWLLP